MTRRKNDQVEEIARRPYTVELEYGDSPADGVLAYLAEWPDAFAAGATREDAVAELGHVIRELAATGSNVASIFQSRSVASVERFFSACRASCTRTPSAARR